MIWADTKQHLSICSARPTAICDTGFPESRMFLKFIRQDFPCVKNQQHESGASAYYLQTIFQFLGYNHTFRMPL